MKKTAVIGWLGLLGLALGAQAQEWGRVISATPIVESVWTPRQVCTTEQVRAPQHNSGAGAVMGAIAGGAIGHAVGDGNGRALATLIGVMGGAALGDRIEGRSAGPLQSVQRCHTRPAQERRTTGWLVVYTYAGKRYQTTLAQAPGARIPLHVSPAGAIDPGSTGAWYGVRPVQRTQPGVVQPAVVVTYQRPWPDRPVTDRYEPHRPSWHDDRRDRWER